MPDDTNKNPFVSRSPNLCSKDMWGSPNDDNSHHDIRRKSLENRQDNVSGALDFSSHGTAQSSVKLESSRENPLDLNGDIWIGSELGTSSNASRVPFTKREKEFLCSLIQKHVYTKVAEDCDLSSLGTFNQKNMSTFCRVPNTAWKAIETEFNSKENVRNRSVKQLRKCWENLKHRGNIDPAALYSGKKLLAQTSLSGAFTLTAAGEGEENHPTPQSLPPPAPTADHGSFVETSFNEEATADPEACPTMVQSSNKIFSPDISPQSNNSDVNTSPKRNSMEENIFRLSSEAAPTLEGMTSKSFTASQIIASLSRSSTTTSQFVASSARPPPVRTPRITNIRTVRSLKPTHTQSPRRRLPENNRDRFMGSRLSSNFSIATKSHGQRIHEMKVKLMSARIKEHEANIQKVNMQMQQAQAHHDVTMRLLRTKAAWYDAHLRKLEKQLRMGDVSLVGEEDEEYLGDSFNEIEMQYEEE